MTERVTIYWGPTDDGAVIMLGCNGETILEQNFPDQHDARVAADKLHDKLSPLLRDEVECEVV